VVESQRKPTSSTAPKLDSDNASHPKETPTNVDRNSLPIWACRDEIVETVRRNRTVIVVGETGSGKTTQLPQFLLDAGLNKRKGGKRGKIAITQPRRVAAMSVAERVAQERGCEVGGEVGYSVRFNDTTTASTMLKFVTDGMLLREAMVSRKKRSAASGATTTTTGTDVAEQQQQQQQAEDYRAMLESFGDMLTEGTSCLHEYDIIILDEAHERTLQTDILFAVVKKLLAVRPTLKVTLTLKP
jgi:HrpA-like RNA helicase